jgi:flagellin
MQVQIGANMDQNTKVYIATMTAQSLGLQNAQGTTGKLSLSTPDEANQSISSLDNALKMLNKQRADLGAYQNRFETAAQGIAIAAENLQASESRIRDVNMATEILSYTKDSILSQAGNAMLAQANVKTQSVLQLLG